MALGDHLDVGGKEKGHSKDDFKTPNIVEMGDTGEKSFERRTREELITSFLNFLNVRDIQQLIQNNRFEMQKRKNKEKLKNMHWFLSVEK